MDGAYCRVDGQQEAGYPRVLPQSLPQKTGFLFIEWIALQLWPARASFRLLDHEEQGEASPWEQPKLPKWKYGVHGLLCFRPQPSHDWFYHWPREEHQPYNYLRLDVSNKKQYCVGSWSERAKTDAERYFASVRKLVSTELNVREHGVLAAAEGISECEPASALTASEQVKAIQHLIPCICAQRKYPVLRGEGGTTSGHQSQRHPSSWASVT